MFTCSLSCITSLLSLFTRAAPSSTVETLWANFNVLTVSPKESTSGLTCANINVLARPPEIQFFHKENLVNIRLISNVFKEMSTHKNKIFKHCKVTNHIWLPHSLQRSFQHKWINKRVKKPTDVHSFLFHHFGYTQYPLTLTDAASPSDKLQITHYSKEKELEALWKGDM